jgi:cytochrome c oxidase subunit II
MMSRTPTQIARWGAALSAALALTLEAPSAQAAWTLNMTPGISALSRQIYDLHMLMFWWCVGIAIPVFGYMIYSMVRYRKSAGAVADTQFVHSTRIEIIWTILPVLILITMAVPAARTLVETENSSGSQLTIRVTGYQWKWGYEYLGSGVRVLSTLDRASDRARQLQSGIDPFSVPNYLLSVDHPLVVPAGVKVRVLLTAQDVIHSWWVPALAIKKDAIPGFVNEAWFDIDADKIGTYRGQCAELCGRDHGFMPIVLEVRSKDDFEQWLHAQQATQTAAPAGAPAAVTAPAPTASATSPSAPTTRSATAALGAATLGTATRGLN